MSCATENQLNSLIPSPKKLEKAEGDLSIAPFICSEHPQFSEYTRTFCESVEKIYDREIFSQGKGGVILRLDESLDKGSYTLDTLGETAILAASDSEGILYAIATLFNLVSFEYGEVNVSRVHIEDRPDKSYRALMVDLAREWKPAHLIYRYIDVCFALKVRYLHLHFMDDQRYTLPSHAFPEITKLSRHYSFEDIEDFRAYANTRGVSIIPEFEVPGHAVKLVEAYPEIFGLSIEGDASDAVIITENGDRIDTSRIISVGSERCENAVLTIINEICDMFPEAEYIHIGGDEANIRAWNYCTECKKYMQEHNIANVEELYCEFVGKIAQAVLNRGKTPIVWEGFSKKYSYLVPKDTIVIGWESYYNYADDLVADGFRVINASWQPLYIIPSYTRYWGCAEIYEWDVYNWQHWWEKSRATHNPINLPPTDQVLGAQICAWESTYDQEINRILENLATLSERTWNITHTCSHGVFAAKLTPFLQRVARLIQDT